MRTTHGIGVLLAVWLVWSAAGIAPVAVLEGDGTAIAMVAQRWADAGPAALAEAYRFEMQSGTYVVLMLLRRTLGLDTLVAFSILSAVAAAALILLSARWISGRTGVSFPVCGLLLMLLQETWTSAYYPNSTVLAATLVALSLNLLAGTRAPWRLSLGGLVFGAACWVRFDAIVVAAAMPLALSPDDSGKTARQALVVATTAAATALAAMVASGAGLHEVVIFYARHRGAAGSWALTLKSFVAFFSLVVLLLGGLGMWRMAAQRRPREVALALVGVLPVLLLLRSSLTTPKYLLYTAPFLALMAAYGVVAWSEFTGRRRRLFALAAVILFAVQYPLGWRIDGAPGYHPQPYPTLLRLASVEVDRAIGEKFSLVAGAGATISTHDALRLSSGILFANWTWRHYKQESAEAADTIVTAIDRWPEGTVDLWVEEPWEAGQLVEYAMLRAGYRRRHAAAGGLSMIWENDGRRVRLLFGEEGLRQTGNGSQSSPLLAFVMWNDRLPEVLQTRFPRARRLTPQKASMNTYLLRAKRLIGPGEDFIAP